jgi:hypothetical protein
MVFIFEVAAFDLVSTPRFSSHGQHLKKVVAKLR